MTLSDAGLTIWMPNPAEKEAVHGRHDAGK